MCGFLGFVGKDQNINKSKFIRALNSLHSRGPDNTDYYFAKNCLLGHKRLSVIDLSKKASQPMTDSSRRFMIVYNGEIYNFRELKKDLSRYNINWLTNTDTEVVPKNIQNESDVDKPIDVESIEKNKGK